MEDWAAAAAAVQARAGGGGSSGGGGGMDKTIYQNLVEMIPLIESFMEQKGSRRHFTRHASMVYTPAPVRKAQAESPLKSKKNKQQRPLKSEEQEQALRHAEEEDAFHLQQDQLMQLQCQVDNLRQQLQVKDNMLRACEADSAAEAARQEDVFELKGRMEELQRSLWERDQAAQALRCQLSEKQQELLSTQSLVERMQMQLLKKNNAASSMAEELNELRMQVAAFQCQAELRSIGEKMEQEDESEEAEMRELSKGMTDDDEDEDEEAKRVEAARRMYLGAVIAAKHNSSDAESMLLLAAELRKRLQQLVLASSCLAVQPMPALTL